ncbi:unnamed protein product [Schistosoma margrebowiei]|uniref:Uncharacterized protein n=1 Tax=Schistosoma margrebowiei TaxID=48269 RepID=A0A183M7G6_9TREM|nr:unnamed protein product [Schistosoma margrebowiei]
MKTSTPGRKRGIQYIAFIQLDDLDLADDPALAAHTQHQMQTKKTSAATAPVSVGLNMYKGKNNILKYNTENTNSITLGGEALDELGTFTDEQGQHHRQARRI